jgi:two-component system OmpR family sensor kinase
VGLGLALVKSIAERHQGRVTCEDRIGGGACFIVSLPQL